MSKLFRQTREDLGKDIKTIAGFTRIKESCLRAIEDEDYDKLPIEVYTRGYIREYARYLGLSSDSGLIPYEKYLTAKQKEPADAPEVPEGAANKEKSHISEEQADACREIRIKPETLQAESMSSASWNRFVWKGVLLLIVAAAVGYQFLSSRSSEKETYAPPFVPQEQMQKEAAQPQSEVPLKQDNPSIPITPEVNPPENQPAPHKKHILEIAANDTAWVQVVIDGSTKRETLMKQGDSVTYEANQNINVFLGNAGGVTMKFDDRELPPGKKGEVMHMSLPDKKGPAAQAGTYMKPSKKVEKTPALKLEAPAENPKENETSPASGKPAESSQP